MMLTVLVVACGVAPARPLTGSDTPEAQSAAIAAAIPSIERIFTDFQFDARAPGLVYGIVADGRLVHVKGLGTQELETRRPVTADTLFRIASVTKAFTALRDEGKLSLDSAAEVYVPQIRAWRYPTSDSPRIRARDLLRD